MNSVCYGADISKILLSIKVIDDKGKEKEMTTEQIWVNQITPAQKTWRGIVILGVYPNQTKIWRKKISNFFPKFFLKKFFF